MSGKRQRVCPNCHFGFGRLSSHFAHSPGCRPTTSNVNLSTTTPLVLPLSLNTENIIATHDDLSSPFQDSEFGVHSSTDDHEDGTFVDPLGSLLLPADFIPPTHLGESTDPAQRDVLSPDEEYELFMYNCNAPSRTPTLVLETPQASSGSQNHNESPSNSSGDLIPEEEGLVEANHGIDYAPHLDTSEAFVVPADYIRGQYCFTKHDRAMMRLYSLCDNAGSPRYLMDQIMTRLNTEISSNQFDPAHHSITKRDAFMS